MTGIGRIQGGKAELEFKGVGVREEGGQFSSLASEPMFYYVYVMLVGKVITVKVACLQKR